MKIKKKTKLNIIVILLSCILSFILLIGIKKENTLISNNYYDYNNLNDDFIMNKEDDLEYYGDFFKKIKSNKNVNILLLGDEITYGTTSENSLYPIDKNINNILNSTYNINSSFKFIEKNNLTVLDGNNLLDSSTDISNIDLAIISFGYNDSIQNLPLDDFTQKYSNLINKIRIKNCNCTIISLLPPNLDQSDEYVSKIKYVCELSNIIYIDLHQYFLNSNTPYEELIQNNLPTVKGYDLILYTLEQFFKSYTN